MLLIRERETHEPKGFVVPMLVRVYQTGGCNRQLCDQCTTIHRGVTRWQGCYARAKADGGLDAESANNGKISDDYSGEVE